MNFEWYFSNFWIECSDRNSMLDSGQPTLARVHAVRVDAPEVQAHVPPPAGEDFALRVVDDVANGFLVQLRENLELLRGAPRKHHFDQNVFEVVSVVNADDELGSEGVHVHHEAVQQRPRVLHLRFVDRLQRKRLVAQAKLADPVRVSVDEVDAVLDAQHGPDAPLDAIDDHLHELQRAAPHRQQLHALVSARKQHGEAPRAGLFQMGQAEEDFVDGGFR